MKFAIIEDNPNDYKTMSDYISQLMDGKSEHYSIAHYDSAEKFLFQLDTEHYDIVFMDIELPGINGMDAAREFRKRVSDTVLVFVTNMAQFALKGYEVEALDFIVKPISFYEFSMKFKRAVRRAGENINDYMVINRKDGLRKIKISEILYIEVFQHRLIYHMKDGECEVFGVMKVLVSKMRNYNFSQCNSGYLVNLAAVKEIDNDKVYVGDSELKISRGKRKEFLDDFTKYCCRSGI